MRCVLRKCRDGITRNSLRSLTEQEIHELFKTRLVVDEETKCWNWIAGTCGTNAPYGNMRFRGRNCKTHRYSYEYFVGPIPAGMIVRHKCDNTICCNPDHLEIGTHRDNSQDCIKRGRFRQNPPKRGEENHRAVLTVQKVKEIVNLKSIGWSHRRIGEYIGIKRTTVAAVWEGRTWGHITGRSVRKKPVGDESADE